MNKHIGIYGLPQFIQKYKAYIQSSGQCQYDTVHFTSDIWPPPDTIRWNFGDPASGGANTSNLANPFHIYNVPGIYTVELYVRHIDNRTDTSWQTITILQSPIPALGPDKSICAGDSVLLDAGVCAGCIYSWDNLTTSQMNISNAQSYWATTSGDYRVTVTNTNGCSGKDTVHVTVNPIPDVTNNPLSKTICTGQSTNIALTSTVPGTNFHWTASLTSGTVTGFSADSGLVINQVLTNPLATAGLVTYHITPKIGSCAGTAVDYQLTVNPGDSVKVTIVPSANNVCAGTSVTFTATPTNGGANPSYQWKVNGGNVGTNSPVFTYVPTNGNLVTCVLTSSNTVCTYNTPATSNSLLMVVNSPLLVSVSVSASANNVCAGTSVTFTATPTNPGTIPVYQWKVNGGNVGTNSPNYTYVPAIGDIVSCTLTSSLTCTTNNPASSNQYPVSVLPNLPVSVSVSASANPVCTGTSVTFTATPTNGGNTPSYQWKVNGGNVGTNNPVYTYIPVNGDLVSCVLTSSETCTSNNPASSIQYPVTVNPNLPVSVSITASQNPFCIGASVNFTATPSNGGATPSYQWKVNGVNTGTNSPTFSYNPVSGDLVTCTLTSSAPCVTNNPASSIQLLMTAITSFPAGVSIAASSNPFCPGSTVSFTATPVNGGAGPSYQWKVNGINAGINSPAFSYNPIDGDSIRCVMTSNLPCVSGNPASSNKIILSGTLAPPVSFTACFDTITTINAKPIKLKGGIPLGGTYFGTGVSGGYYYPNIAGPGTHVITYSYTNVSLCTASKNSRIHQFTSSPFTCGNNLIDIRDNKVYTTIQIGSQCWMAEDLNYGSEILFTQNQRDNCIAEKYHNPASSIQHPASVYQWDELMRYDDSPASQGLCPPGWHIPTENEWNTLFTNWVNNAFAGSPLKYSGYSGFNTLLNGAGHMNVQLDYAGFATFYWSSTSHGPYKAWSHAMNDFDPSVAYYPSSRVNAFSVRCLKD
ncbi:MAG: PKD domain-containing protein [Bacteroidetes bacterium]|nr:PKD domain-containing protein [Bacteroidota bacterium]